MVVRTEDETERLLTGLTEGPWHISTRVHISWEHGRPRNYPEYDILATNPVKGVPHVGYQGDFVSVALGLDSEADALMIAAAPDMFALLKQLYRTGGMGIEVHERIKSVIEKAEGVGEKAR